MNELMVRAIAEIELEAIKFAVKKTLKDFADDTAEVFVKEIYIQEVFNNYLHYKLETLNQQNFEDKIIEGIERVDKSNREL